MSVADELNRLKAAKTAIKESISNKGVAVPDTATYDTFAGYIDQIQTGEEIKYENVTVSISADQYLDQLKGVAAVSVSYSGKTETYTYTGSNIEFEVLPGFEYILSFSPVENFDTPEPLTFDSKWNGENICAIHYKYHITESVIAYYKQFSSLSSARLLYTGYSPLPYEGYFDAMSIDGGEWENIVGTYNFGDTNKHSVAYKLKGDTIGDYIFQSCSELKEIVIPNTVTTIGKDTFWRTSLSSVTIPKSVISIGSGAFEDIGTLMEVIMESPTPPTMSYSVFYGSNNVKIYVPDEAVDTYKAATNWSDYKSKILPISQRP